MKEQKIKNVLVPIDFSQLSIDAIESAKNLAAGSGAAVHLIHVQQPLFPAMYYAPALPMPVSFETEDEVRRQFEERLRSLAKETGVTGRCLAVAGAPVFDEICAFAREISADVIVTPTHGHTGLKHLFLGSTAERLVQHAPCPVLVVKKSKEPSPRANLGFHVDTILAPVDFSECSLAGLRYAIQLASRLAAKVVVVHVVDYGPALTADGYGIYDFATYREMVCQSAEKEMQKFLRRIKFGTVKFEAKVIVGFTVDGICCAAREYHADLIVSATHGRSGLKHVMIGSTAEAVVRHAPCSVFVIPSHPAKRRKTIGSAATSSERSSQSRPNGAGGKQPPAASDRLTRRFHKLTTHAFPERRLTNKFRESHKLVRH